MPDWLSFKATGQKCRSLCSTTCKWTYTKAKGWPVDLFSQIGLDEWRQDSFGCPDDIKGPTQCVGMLTAAASQALGLSEKTRVASSLIDAYAGALGALAAVCDGTMASIQTTLVVVSGTSACHMAMSPRLLHVPGVWGPYESVLMPDQWSLEGGQSVAGKLLDFVIATHPAAEACRHAANKQGISIYAYLNSMAAIMARNAGVPSVAHLVRHLHVYPDFHGNRSPLANADLRGMLTGLDLEQDEANLIKRYVASLSALAYETKWIIETMKMHGLDITQMVVCGSLSHNDLFMSLNADICGLPVILPNLPELTTAFGSAIHAESVLNTSLDKRMCLLQAMNMFGKDSLASQILPSNDDETKKFHDKKYQVFCKMLRDQLEYREMMMSK